MTHEEALALRDEILAEAEKLADKLLSEGRPTLVSALTALDPGKDLSDPKNAALALAIKFVDELKVIQFLSAIFKEAHQEAQSPSSQSPSSTDWLSYLGPHRN